MVREKKANACLRVTKNSIKKEMIEGRVLGEKYKVLHGFCGYGGWSCPGFSGINGF